MVSGPVRNSAYSAAMAALPRSVAARWFMVIVPWTLNTSRSCRWSCRLPPTPESSCRTVMPSCCRTSPGPMPESWSSRGVPIAPAARTTSRRAVAICSWPSAAEADAGAAPCIEHEPACLRTGQHGQVRPAAGGTQERLGGGPADAAPLGHLEVAAALVVAPVEVVGLGDAALLGRVAKGVEDLPRHPRRLDPPLAAGAVELARTLPVILRPLEQRQHVVPAPAPVAELPPVIVVGRLPAHVDHAVDRGAAADHPAARIVQRRGR